jgi:hypothetical protein
MKARVRGATEGELLVGSNLEFLRVGRSLELEDVDRGGKRPAHIDRVDVEVDKTSRVPQLVVTLRYDDVGAEEQALRVPVPEIAHDLSADPGAPIPAAAQAVSSFTSAHREDEMTDEMQAAKMMRSKFSTAAADIMPKMAELGSRAKTTLALLFSKAVERSRAATAGGAPRRMTSPPPSGALHASGKRVVRDGEGDDDYDSQDRTAKGPKIGKKAMLALGGTAGLLTVITAMALHKSSSPPPGAAVGATDANAATSAVAQVADSPVGATGALQANVPLFGPTTLSTTEPVAPAAPLAGAPAGGPNLAFGTPGAAAGAPPLEEVDDQKSESDQDGKSGSSKSHTKVASFGHGKVAHATVLRLKTDGTITALHGARSATGFTVSVPGRRAMDNGPSLAGHDPRIASVHVSNGAKGSEVTFQFKDGVPPYLVSAKGHDVRIALGRSGEAEDAPKDAPKHSVTAKKRPREVHHRSKRD